MALDEKTAKKIQELQILEQNLQHLLIEKQGLQVELNEISNALNELGKSSGDVYRITAGIMVKSDARALVTELEEKKKLLELRIQALEKQEKLVEGKADSLKKEFANSINKNNNNL